MNLEKKISEKGIIPPKEGAPPEEVRAFYQSLGAPEAPDGYGTPEGWTAPEGFELDGGLVQSMREAAFEAGVPKSAWDKLFTKFTETQLAGRQQLIDQLVARREQSIKDLQQKWGQAFEARAKGALESARYLFGDNYDAAKAVTLADGTSLVDHPLMLDALAKLHDAMGEGQIAEGTARRTTLTPQEAEDALQELTADAEHMAAYLDDRHPGHRHAVEKHRQLQQMRAGRAPARSDTGATSTPDRPAGGFVTSRWQP